MDPITIIVGALIAGAAAGGSEAASAAVRDAYTALRNRIQRAGADSETSIAIETNERDPGSNVAEIEAVIARHRLVEDLQVRAVAEALLEQLPADRVADAKNHIDLRHAKGVQVGDRNTQQNRFG